MFFVLDNIKVNYLHITSSRLLSFYFMKFFTNTALGIFIFSCLLLHSNWSQAQGNSKIKGAVIDSTSSSVVEFASVALYLSDGKNPIDGSTADEKGQFTVANVKAGRYNLLVSFIGYQDKIITGISIVNGKDIDLGAIKLIPSTKLLEEVTITGAKSMIEEKVDRLVYNAEKDISAKGGDATDILRKVPMLSVDMDGNVSLRGSGNIRVLVNNKPSTIIASNVADALKQIPADMIKSVEVITSPSAKYDAEGSGGIINIITKKNNLEGLTLNIDSGIGNRGTNLGLNGSYRQGKFGMTLGGFGRAFYNKAESTLEQTVQNNKTLQNGTAKDRGMFGSYSLGMDYDLGEKQALSAGVRYGTRNFTQKQNMTIQEFEEEIRLASTDRKINRKDNSGTIDMNIDYIRIFKPQQEWSISTLYSRTGLTNNFTTDILNASGNTANSLRNENKNYNAEITLQSDYQTPIRKNQILEFGVKAIFRTVDSDYKYLMAAQSGSFIPSTTSPSGSLNYNQNVGAGYVSYTLTTPNKYNFKIGTRYEFTGIDAELANDIKVDIPNYGNLVPSINVSKNITESTSLKAGYNRRLQRPGINQLNPNVNISNPQSISTGNPGLSPEMTDNFELALSTNIKKTYLNVSVFGRQTNKSITQVRMALDTLPGAILTTFENIGTQKAYGMNIFANVFITSKWTVNGSIDLLQAHMEGQTTNTEGVSVPVSNSGFNYGGRLMSQLQLTKGWGAQAFAFYRGKEVQLQGTRTGFYMYSLGVKKDLPNKKGSIGFAAENFIGKGVKLTSDLETAQFRQVSATQLYNKNFKVTINYSIGKMKFDAPKKKTKSVKNTDMMGGGD